MSQVNEETRCPSCEHSLDFHSEGGCWYSITVGTVNRDMVCQCPLPTFAIEREGES